MAWSTLFSDGYEADPGNWTQMLASGQGAQELVVAYHTEGAKSHECTVYHPTGTSEGRAVKTLAPFAAVGTDIRLVWDVMFGGWNGAESDWRANSDYVIADPLLFGLMAKAGVASGFRIWVNTDSTLTLTVHSASPASDTSVNTVAKGGLSQHFYTLQLDATIANSGGSASLKVDGVEWCSLSGIDTYVDLLDTVWTGVYSASAVTAELATWHDNLVLYERTTPSAKGAWYYRMLNRRRSD